MITSYARFREIKIAWEHKQLTWREYLAVVLQDRYNILMEA
jgi:hypothetical protein